MIDGGDDGMPIDNNVANCGNGISEPGEICFKPADQMGTGIAGVFDAQFIDADGDGMRDIAFLTPTGYVFHLYSGGGFSGVNTTGPSVPGSTRMRGVNLSGDPTPELVNNNKVAGRVEVWDIAGGTSTLAGMIASETNDAQAIALGHTTGVGDPLSIVMVFSTRLRAFQLPAGGALSPLAQSGTGFLLSGAKDVAVGDIDKNMIDEIAVADADGIEVFKNVNSTITKTSSPNIGQPVDAIAKCDVDGDNTDEFVYAIRATGTVPGRVGTARWMSSTWQLPGARMIQQMGAPLECDDFDKDGRGDAVVVATDTSSNVDILILRGRGDGTFEAPIPFRIPDGITQIRANVDFNNDGVSDIIMTSPVTGLITILESNP